MTMITATLLHEVASGGCGLTTEQMNILGVPRPLRTGWKKLLIGKFISDAEAERLHALKGMGKKRRRALAAEATQPLLFS